MKQKDSQSLKAAGRGVGVIRNVLLHVATSNEASFAGNLVVYRFVAVDPASRQEQPSLGWRHFVDENLAERVHPKQGRQLFLFCLPPEVRIWASHSFRVAAWLLQLRGEQGDEE